MAIWSTSVSLGNATDPTVLVNTAPLWVSIGSLIFFRNRLRLGFWVGCTMAILGAALVIGIENILENSISHSSLLALTSAVLFAGVLLITERGRKCMDALSYYWLVTATATVTLLVINIVLRQQFIQYPAETYLNFLGLGLVSQVIGWLALTYALGILPAAVVSPSLLGQPVITALLAVTLLKEELTWVQALGGVTVLIGVFLVLRSQRIVQQKIVK